MNALTVTKIVLLLILVFLAVQVYTLVSILMSKSDQITVMAKKSVDIAMGRSKSSYFNYDKITADLSKYGIMYMFHDYNLEPSTFIIAKLIAAIGTGLLVFIIAPSQIFIALIGVVAGFFIPDGLMRLSNASDNDSIRDDVLLIYRTLKIHARAGVYITDSLIECQRSILNPRLKQALNEMNNNILSSRVTVEEAVDQFNSRFCNEQIDDLSIIIKQAIRTGRSADLLTDISKQIETSNNIQTQKKKDTLKRKTAITQVMFFGIISALMIYLVAMEMAVSLGGM